MKTPKRRQSFRNQSAIVLHVETTWKWSFPRRFNVESTWCICRVICFANQTTGFRMIDTVPVSLFFNFGRMLQKIWNWYFQLWTWKPSDTMFSEFPAWFEQIDHWQKKCLKLTIKKSHRHQASIQKQSPEVFYNKSVFRKFCKIPRKTPVPESLF